MADGKDILDDKHMQSREKPLLVKSIFDSVAHRYDIMNDFMSFGIHRVWKKTFVNMINPSSDMVLLDVAGGTGDIAFRFLQKGGGHVTVCDFTESMVHVGRSKAFNKGIFDKIDWVVGDAQSLPIKDKSFDVYSIAFGLRNVADIDFALKEAYRVLKPGGRFMCLEFSPAQNPVLEKIYTQYSFSILPKIGEVVTRDRRAYLYLVKSIRQFPAQDVLVEKMADAGFQNIQYNNLTGGIVAIHSGWRI